MQLVEPAVGGTLNVLESCAKAGSVKRVVMTSSMAAVAYKQADKDHVFTSEDWSDVELLKKKELWYMLRYGGRGMQLLEPVCSLCFWLCVCSKTLAEQAAWDFVNKQDKFDMVSINPTLTTGPILQPVLNTSTSVVLDLLVGPSPPFRLPFRSVPDALCVVPVSRRAAINSSPSRRSSLWTCVTLRMRMSTPFRARWLLASDTSLWPAVCPWWTLLTCFRAWRRKASAQP